ncbi:uncharacterized protein BJX67DRAFT_384263 [Aspergillus lucknowensis]|uniref:Uncharacterized protein n=1 Tax=Aspergillus lucknowensis TaxID=176173 RepID=A0ABR4LH98_9EURO
MSVESVNSVKDIFTVTITTMARQPRSNAPETETMPVAINMEDLALCKRDRDFTNLLDLKNEYHSSFIKQLRAHEHNDFHTWRELQASADARRACISRFLNIYGMEYWGSEKNREKYLMDDSIERDDVVKYPDNSDE